MSEASHRTHRDSSPAVVPCAVVTVSDTRTIDDDKSGALLKKGLEDAGHRVLDYRILRDEPADIVQSIRELVAAGVRAVILTGGTGITARDGTYEAVTSLLEKEIPGFGEIFRQLSYEEIGAAAIMSRAVAGLFGRAVVISIPGSSGACRLALEKLILPELGHMVREASR